jgi:hypothetical protein
MFFTRLVPNSVFQMIRHEHVFQRICPQQCFSSDLFRTAFFKRFVPTSVVQTICPEHCFPICPDQRFSNVLSRADWKQSAPGLAKPGEAKRSCQNGFILPIGSPTHAQTMAVMGPRGLQNSTPGFAKPGEAKRACQNGLILPIGSPTHAQTLADMVPRGLQNSTPGFAKPGEAERAC